MTTYRDRLLAGEHDAKKQAAKAAKEAERYADELSSLRDTSFSSGDRA